MKSNKNTGAHRWFCWVAALAAPLMLGGCQAKQGPVAPGDPNTGGGYPITVSDPGDQGYNAPPHHFNPRQHPPRNRPGAPPPPDLASLPKLVNHIDQCYGRSREPAIASGGSAPRPSSSSRPKRGSVGSGRHVPYNPSPSKPKDAKKDAKPATKSPEKKRAPSAELNDPFGGAPGGGAGTSLDNMAGGDMAPPPASAPAPEPTRSVATESKRDDRAERRRDRKRKRESEKTSAPVEMAEAEEAPADFDDAGDSLAIAQAEPEPDPDDQYEDWGAAIYLSNDDTMSLSSAQRVMFAIDNFLPVPLEHIRPHELLNYFSFESDAVAPEDDFSIRAEIAPVPHDEGIYTLALAVRGRPLDLNSRRNANLSLVIDRSGSMQDEGRMDYLKRGLQQMTGQLKRGDIVHMALFDHAMCTPIENFVVGRDDPRVLQQAIDGLRPRGATDIHLGLTRGYELADRAYQPTYTNRVVLVTDALANTGVTDERLISMIGKYYDQRRIRLSGVGVGRTFNDSLLDKLTEKGRGAYVFLGSEAEVDAVFGARFISMIETTAGDVHFRLHLPPSLRMNVFYGEESSVVKEDVQSIHYFANTSQLFLSDLMARGGRLRPQDQVMLTIEYEDPETGQEMVEEQAWTLGDIAGESANVRKGRLLMRWADGLSEMAMRPLPSGFGGAGSWSDESGWQRCDDIKVELRDMSVGIADGEVRRVGALWDKFCARYERPRNPVRRTPQGVQDSWPGARG
ncbi:MAG: VWA domain-containing protein [Myxococcales bacterium]|nr:VWA domain-containing protein [Myxococcales bacterium]